MRSLITCVLLLAGISGYAQSIPRWGVIKHYGSMFIDRAIRVRTDVQGNNYTLMSYEDAITFGTTSFPGPYFPDYAIVKHDKDGKLLYATRVFTNATSAYHLSVTSIAIDDQQNVYVCGSFNDSVGVGNLKLGITKGRFDVFIAKIDKNGNTLWVRNLGGYGRETIYDIGVDPTGNIYLGGTFYGYTTDIGTYHFVSVTSGDNLLLCKLNTAGVIQWIKATGSGSITPARVAMDNNGDVIISGTARDQFTFDGTTIYNYASGSSLFACKFSAAGSLQWVYTPVSSGPNVKVLSMAADRKGNVLIAGRYGFKAINFSATDSLVGGPTYQYFFASLGPSGTINWARGFDAHIDVDYSIAVAADPDNNWYVAGRIYGYWVYNSKDTVAKTNYSSVMLKYNSAGAKQWTVSTGINVGPNDIACDNANNIYQVGNYGCMACVTPFGDSLLPAQPGNPDADVYIAKLSAQELIRLNALAKTAYCAGDTIRIPFVDVDTVFKAGNTFRLELSDNSGVFTNAMQLDTKITARANDTFVTSIPNTITPGTQYRLRITSSTPVFYAWDNGSDITINAQPAKPVISINGEELNTTASGKLEWFKDGVSLGVSTATYKPQASGIYTVKSTSSSGCFNLSDVQWFAPVGIATLSSNAVVSIYPNPVTGNVLHIYSEVAIANLYLLSVDGRVVQTIPVKEHTPSGNIEVPVDNRIAKGLYLLKCETADGAVIVKKLWLE